MCIALFLGLDAPLPERPWVKQAPAPFVRLLADPAEPPAPYFTKPQVYEIGDEDGCACGFHAPGIGVYDSNDAWEMARLEKAKRSIDWLRALLTQASQTDPAFQLYVGDVDEFAAPTGTRRIPVGQLAPAAFSIEDYVAETAKEPETMYASPWDMDDFRGPLWTVFRT